MPVQMENAWASINQSATCRRNMPKLCLGCGLKSPEPRWASASASMKVKPKVKKINAYNTRAWGDDKENTAMPSFLAKANNAKSAIREKEK